MIVLMEFVDLKRAVSHFQSSSCFKLLKHREAGNCILGFRMSHTIFLVRWAPYIEICYAYSECLNGSRAVHSGLQQPHLAAEIQSVLTMQGQSEPGEGKPAVEEDQKNNFFCKGVS